MTAFADFYRGKTVLVTGHTGFKGSWFATWLVELGAKVIGYALDPPSEPNNFSASCLGKRMLDVRGNVCDYESFKGVFDQYSPEIVFHLAAQSIVNRGFEEPRVTFATNLMGTVNVLDIAQNTPSVKAAVCITSDKCYENQEWCWGYRETDKLGGHDPYSASKACAELAIGVYQDDRFKGRSSSRKNSCVPVSSTRAGNVIGGGDWTRDRLIPDIIRAVASNQDVLIRNPDAIRPWQHVLEALSGYLWLALLMVKHPGSYISNYNFGPEMTIKGVTVSEVAQRLIGKWKRSRSRIRVQPDESGAESSLLRLDCSRAKSELGWRPSWELDETLDHVASWYQTFYQSTSRDMFAYSVEQIEKYTQSAQKKEVAWAVS